MACDYHPSNSNSLSASSGQRSQVTRFTISANTGAIYPLDDGANHSQRSVVHLHLGDENRLERPLIQTN